MSEPAKPADAPDADAAVSDTAAAPDPLDAGAIAAAVDRALSDIAAAADLDELKTVRLAHAGEKSPMSLANRQIGSLPKDQKAAAGKNIGPARGRINQALAIYNKVLEGDHPTIAAALILMGRIRTAEGNYTGALAALDQARALYARLYGPRNAAVGDADFYAAEAEAKRGAIDAALMRLARTKAIYDENYGPDDPDQVELLMQRSRILADAGRTAEARQNCVAGVALQAKLNPSDPQLPASRAKCAALTVRS